MVPPSRPNVTRLADDKVMVRWFVSSRQSLPIQFFKVQYRLLGSTPKPTKRSQWNTLNEDIPPTVRMFEVDNLKPDNYYRFRIAAVYSNNDNQLSNVSKFFLPRGDHLDPKKMHLPAPNLTSVQPISETAIVLHWLMPEHIQTPIDGFYAYYRPASTAGEYLKATVDGMDKRHFKIDGLEPGTAYEFKLQSFTASAASDFMAIITGKTLSMNDNYSIFYPSFPKYSNNFFFFRTIDASTTKRNYTEKCCRQGGQTLCIVGGRSCWSMLNPFANIYLAVHFHEATKDIWYTLFVVFLDMMRLLVNLCCTYF